MTMITAMSTRGQIVLPKKIRAELKLDVGTQFAVFFDSGNILLKPITIPAMSEFDSLLKKAQQLAIKSGMKESDIAKAIKTVRKKNDANSN
mgnify:CR=1 FL=1